MRGASSPRSPARPSVEPTLEQDGGRFTVDQRTCLLGFHTALPQAQGGLFGAEPLVDELDRDAGPSFELASKAARTPRLGTLPAIEPPRQPHEKAIDAFGPRQLSEPGHQRARVAGIEERPGVREETEVIGHREAHANASEIQGCSTHFSAVSRLVE